MNFFKIRDCREMYRLFNTPSKFAFGRVCNNYQIQRIIYAWAKDAPELKLPEGTVILVQ